MTPEPPYPVGAANNCKRAGWTAYFAGHERDDCPYPSGRRDLWDGFREGWDAADAHDGKPTTPNQTTSPSVRGELIELLGEWIARPPMRGSGNCGVVGVADLQRIRDALTSAEADLKADLREVSKYAAEAGEAKGRLEMSEAAGIVDGWRERAEAAEARSQTLEVRVGELEEGLRRIRDGREVPLPGGGFVGDRPVTHMVDLDPGEASELASALLKPIESQGISSVHADRGGSDE